MRDSDSCSVVTIYYSHSPARISSSKTWKIGKLHNFSEFFHSIDIIEILPAETPSMALYSYIKKFQTRHSINLSNFISHRILPNMRNELRLSFIGQYNDIPNYSMWQVTAVKHEKYYLHPKIIIYSYFELIQVNLHSDRRSRIWTYRKIQIRTDTDKKNIHIHTNLVTSKQINKYILKKLMLKLCISILIIEKLA